MNSIDEKVRSLVSRIVDGNQPGALRLMGKHAAMARGRNDVKQFLHMAVKKSNYSDKAVSKLLSAHPDMPYFKAYFTGDATGGKDLNCGGCAAAAGFLLSTGDEAPEVTAKAKQEEKPAAISTEYDAMKENMKFAQKVMIGSAILFAAILIGSIINKGE